MIYNIIVDRKLLLKVMVLFTATLLVETLFTPSVVVGVINNDFTVKEHWVVVICGGAKDPGAHLWEKFIAGPEAIRKTSLHAYETFKQLGYDDEHIYFILDRNVSYEGKDAVVSKETVRYAVEGWLANKSDENDDICIIIHAHGSRKAFVGIWSNQSHEWEKISAKELDEWIDKISYSSCTVIIDACFSGSFINTLSQQNRIVITSTSPYTVGTGLDELIFSYFFLNELSKNVSYGKAWEYADEKLSRMRINEMPTNPEFGVIKKVLIKLGIHLIQHPWIDDNGDRKGHGTIFVDKLPLGGDGYLALETFPC